MSHRNLKYVKQDQPSFIRKFKQRAGLKPEATVNDKMPDQSDECDDQEKDDEKPVVVVLNDGDLTAEQANAHDNPAESDVNDSTEKMVFRKPTKRPKESALSATTKKSKVDEEKKKKSKKEKDDKKEKKSKNAPKVGSLLSFDDEEG